VGLGNSVQKLFYLPEAHTDFVFSIWAEETGFVGALLLIGLFLALVLRMFHIGRRRCPGQAFAGYLCFGVALMFSGQAFVNMGVSAGLLPTKGLTLPLISYGGTSLITACALLGIVCALPASCSRRPKKAASAMTAPRRLWHFFSPAVPAGTSTRPWPWPRIDARARLTHRTGWVPAAVSSRAWFPPRIFRCTACPCAACAARGPAAAGRHVAAGHCRCSPPCG
jgi:hypothetical protein